MFMWRVPGDDWVGEEDEGEAMDVFCGDREFTSTELVDVLGSQIRCVFQLRCYVIPVVCAGVNARAV
jgi:hypothetical protein